MPRMNGRSSQPEAPQPPKKPVGAGAPLMTITFVLAPLMAFQAWLSMEV